MVLGLFFGNRFNDEVYVSDDRPSYGNDSYNDRSHTSPVSQLPRNTNDVYRLAQQFCDRNNLDLGYSPIAHDAFHELLGNGADQDSEDRQTGADVGAGLIPAPPQHEINDRFDSYHAGLRQGQRFAQQHPEVVRLLRRCWR